MIVIARSDSTVTRLPLLTCRLMWETAWLGIQTARSKLQTHRSDIQIARSVNAIAIKAMAYVELLELDVFPSSHTIRLAVVLDLCKFCGSHVRFLDSTSRTLASRSLASVTRFNDRNTTA